MNRLRFSYKRNSAAARPAFAVLLAALIPAIALGQQASPPPATPDQTQTQPNQTPVPVTTTPAAPAAPGTDETVILSPFEVNAAQAQGYFTPNSVTGTRLANNIGDIPSDVTFCSMLNSPCQQPPSVPARARPH